MASNYYGGPAAIHPQPSFEKPYEGSPIQSHRGSAYDSQQALGSGRHSTSKYQYYAGIQMAPRRPAKPKRTGLIFVAMGILIVLILAVILPVYFVVIKPNQNNGTGGSGSSSGSGSGPTGTGSGPDTGTSGRDGSTVTTESGSTFTYQNSFGGLWVQDPNNPLDNSAQAQSYSPPLNQSWDYLNNQIYGVNLGGWLVLEPFISPALFQKYLDAPTGRAIDEWSLSVAMAADTSPGGGLSQIEDHYKTFITEQDFAEIAKAGLNWVRIPIGFWAIEKYPGEPFLEKVSWTYFLKAIQWARKYGLRINIDLHSLPGSQNGWNHSGKSGKVGMMNGVMGVANAQRSLDYIRVITEFISQPQYKDVIPFFGITNEAKVSETDPNAIPKADIGAFFFEAHRMIRSITGAGAGNGPVISIHDGFIGIGQWSGFMAGADRLAMDTHPYFAFANVRAAPIPSFVEQACGWAEGLANSRRTIGITTAGEYSNAINDCGLFVNNAGLGTGTRYEGNYNGASSPVLGDCKKWIEYENWTPLEKSGFRDLMLTSMDAFKNGFFWTWKIGPSRISGKVEAPMWSYQLGLQEGWAPLDPRASAGKCASVGKSIPSFVGPYQAYQTGGPGTQAVVNPDQAALYGAWPPAQLGQGLVVAALPTYTATGAIPTLPVSTFTKPGTRETFDVGTGWFSTQDTTPMHVPITDCTYPDQWDAVGIAIPPLCPAGAAVPPVPVPGATPSVGRRWAAASPTQL